MRRLIRRERDRKTWNETQNREVSGEVEVEVFGGNDTWCAHIFTYVMIPEVHTYTMRCYTWGVHIHTYTHTYIHTYTHTHIHTNMMIPELRTYTHMMLPEVHTYMIPEVHTHNTHDDTWGEHEHEAGHHEPHWAPAAQHLSPPPPCHMSHCFTGWYVRHDLRYVQRVEPYVRHDVRYVRRHSRHLRHGPLYVQHDSTCVRHGSKRV